MRGGPRWTAGPAPFSRPVRGARVHVASPPRRSQPNDRRQRQTRREAGTQSQRPRAVRGGSAAGATNDWRSNLVNLRTITAGGATLLALTLAPSAHATVQVLPDGSAVCNTASQNWQGGSLSI